MNQHRQIAIALFLSIAFGLYAQIPNPNKISYRWKTDTAKHTYEFKELSIATEKDAIPTLDFPNFITKSDPRNKFYAHEPAIVVNFGGEARAYPLSILTLFELSNDTVGGKNIMVSYCPMCNSALVFNRNIATPKGEKTMQFGVSGLLIHNDMVMYDRETESWWGQLTGEGIAGEHSGVALNMMRALLISVDDFFDRYPNGKILAPLELSVLAKKDGHKQFHHLEHGDNLSKEYFLPEKIDKRLPPMEHVLGIHYQEHDKIYPYRELAKKQVVHETIGKTNIVIFYHDGMVSVLDEDDLASSKKVGSAAPYVTKVEGVNLTFKKAGRYFKDDQTGSIWDITGYCKEGKHQGVQLDILPHTNHFAFAYLAFFPKAEIYGQK